MTLKHGSLGQYPQVVAVVLVGRWEAVASLSRAGLIGQKVQVVVGILLAIGLIVLFRKVLIENRILAFFATGMILSIVPFAMGPLQDRLLLWSGLGAAGMLGELFSMRREAFGRLQRGVARTLLFTNVVVSLLFYVPTLFGYQILEKPSQNLASAIPAQDTVMFSGPWDIFSWYPPAMAADGLGESGGPACSRRARPDWRAWPAANRRSHGCRRRRPCRARRDRLFGRGAAVG
jgi:hypothetical protein